MQKHLIPIDNGCALAIVPRAASSHGDPARVDVAITLFGVNVGGAGLSLDQARLVHAALGTAIRDASASQ